MAAFDAIYHKYCHKLYEFVHRYLKQKEDTREIVQEVFIRIWESRSKIDAYSSFEAYLFTIAYNSTISMLRKRLTESRSKAYLMSLQLTEQVDDVINELQYHELENHLNSSISQLTPRQREIYRLSRTEGMSHREIAEKLNISENTVKNHLVTSLKYLRSRLDSKLLTNLLFAYLFM